MKPVLLSLMVGVLAGVFPASVLAGTFMSEYLELRTMMGRAEYDASFDRCKAMIVESPQEGVLYETLAEVAMYSGRIDEAMSFLWQRVEDGTGLSLCYFGLGSLSYRREDDRNAIMFLSKAIELGVEVPECYSAFIYSYERLEGIDPTLRLMTSLCHRNPGKAGYWYALALAYWANGDFSQVLRHLEEAVRIMPTQNRYHHAKQTVLMITTRNQETPKTHSHLIDVAFSGNDFHGFFLLKSGNIIRLQERGLISDAINECNDLLSISERYGYVRWSGWGYRQLADIYSVLSMYQRSVEAAEHAYANACLCRDYQLVHSSLARSFDSNIELLGFEKAITCLERRLTAYGASESRKYLIGILLDSSRLFVLVGQPEVSLELVISALDISERTALDRRLFWEIHMTLGSIYEFLNDEQSALRHYRITESITPSEPFYSRVQAITQGNLGSVMLRTGNPEQALQRFRSQLAFANEARYMREIAYGHLNLGRAYAGLGRSEIARKELLVALEGSVRDSIPLCRMLALRALAHLYLTSGDTIDAKRALIAQDSILGLNSFAGSVLLGDRLARGYGLRDLALPQLLCAVGELEEGFLYEDAKRGMLQPTWRADLVLKNEGARNEVHDAKLQETTVKLRACIDSLYSRPEMGDRFTAMSGEALFLFPLVATLELRRQNELAYQDNDLNRSAKGTSRRTIQDLVQIQKHLDREDVVLSFVVSDTKSYACVLNRDTIAFAVSLLSRDSILILLKRLSHITDPSESQALILPPLLDKAELMLCERLYSGLLGPVEEYLRNHSRMFIIPPARVPPIPFDLMIIPGSGQGPSTDVHRGKFLAEEFEISYIPDFSSLIKEDRRPTESNLQWIGFFSPDLSLRRGSRVDPELIFLRDRLGVTTRGRLESVQDEIEGIEKGFGDQGKSFSGVDAERTRLLSQAGIADVVHIAAHGYFHDRIPWASGFLLPAKAEAGSPTVLSAFDIFEYQLARRLLVLSGCSSIKASGLWSEDAGLRMPHHGSLAVVGSWSIVDDRGTANLMKKFYAHLQEGQSSSASLALAKREVIRETGGMSPYWASFSHIGIPVQPFESSPEHDLFKVVWIWSAAGIATIGVAVMFAHRRFRWGSRGGLNVGRFR